MQTSKAYCLTKREQECLHWIANGKTAKEIAEILNLDMNHVKVLLFRARKQVKETLTRINNYGISHA